MSNTDQKALAQEILDKSREQVGTLIARRWPDMQRILEKEGEISFRSERPSRTGIRNRARKARRIAASARPSHLPRSSQTRSNQRWMTRHNRICRSLVEKPLNDPKIQPKLDALIEAVNEARYQRPFTNWTFRTQAIADAALAFVIALEQQPKPFVRPARQ